jgi:predicted O-methyltransferase YrrM
MTWLERANEAGVTGFMHSVELEKLVELAESRHVLEIGSYRGLSAWCMAHSAKSVLCVDTFRAWTNGQTQNTEEEGFTTLDTFLKNTERFPHITHMVATSEQAWNQNSKKFDMIFLDANHEYEAVKQDIKTWWPRIKTGGIIAFHDYGHDDYKGVKRAVDETFGDLGPYDPANQQWIVTLRWIFKDQSA